MQRLRLYDVMISRLPSLMGLCQDNISQIANYVNSAQRRLLYAKEAGDEGWYGTYAEIVFNVSQATPYITFPREVARIQAMNVCKTNVPINNQWYEYLTFGNGSLPKDNEWQSSNGILTGAFMRNNVVTATDMTNAPQYIVAYFTDAQDQNKRTLIQGLDASGNPIYTQDVVTPVTGVFLNSIGAGPVQTPMTLTMLTGIQKDVTIGEVRYYQHDPTTGDEVLLLTMQPGETTASYRRYYIHNLPASCCWATDLLQGSNATSTTQIQVIALAKMDLIPAVVQTDWLLIQNLEAIIEECMSVRYSEMDTANSAKLSIERHRQAIGLLNGEQVHYMGLNNPAVGFKPFGSASLSRHKIGSLI